LLVCSRFADHLGVATSKQLAALQIRRRRDLKAEFPAQPLNHLSHHDGSLEHRSRIMQNRGGSRPQYEGNNVVADSTLKYALQIDFAPAQGKIIVQIGNEGALRGSVCPNQSEVLRKNPANVPRIFCLSKAPCRRSSTSARIADDCPSIDVNLNRGNLIRDAKGARENGVNGHERNHAPISRGCKSSESHRCVREGCGAAR
jgi:hypothetical protein